METKEFEIFCKEVKGNEGNKCHYPTRLDTYGCGCPSNRTTVAIYDGQACRRWERQMVGFAKP